MSSIGMIRALSLMCCALLAAGVARGQSSSVADAEVQKCEDRVASVQRDVLMKYDDALAELQAGFQKAADLEGAVAVRNERKRAAADQSLTEKNFVNEPKTLRALQTQTLAKSQELVAQLVSDVLPKLVELKRQLTVSGKLDEALSVRSSIEKLQNNHVPSTRPDPAVPLAAESLLVAFGADRARAEKIYKGQTVTVRGVAGGFRQDPGDTKNYQVFVTGGTSGGWVQCTFSSGQNRFREERAAFNTPVLLISARDSDSAVLRVQKGAAIDVRGVCEGWDEVVRLGKCEVSR